MTQEEVDLIYDYLHENYEYVDGEMISKITTGRNKKFHACGSFYLSSNNTISNMIQISINKKKYRISLGHAIYIFHHKIKPNRLVYLDKNILNTKITNLKNLSMKQKASNRIGKGYSIDKRRANKPYNARLYINGKYKSLGMYCTAEEAHAAYIKAKEENQRQIQQAPGVGNIPVEKIQRAVESISRETRNKP